MYALKTECQILKEFLEPTLLIVPIFNLRRGVDVPILTTGFIKSQDGKIIGEMREIHRNSATNTEPFLAVTSSQTDDVDYRHQYSPKLIFSPNKQIINHIEDLRNRDKDKSVVFYFDFFTKYISARNSFNYKNLDSIFDLNTKYSTGEIIINQSDWLKNYSSQLGIGEFLVAEIKFPEKINLNSDFSNVYNSLYEELKKMNNAILNGDWDKVVLLARRFIELIPRNKTVDKNSKIDNDFLARMRNLGHNEEGIKNFSNSLFEMFHFLSKYSHSSDHKGNFKPVPQANKYEAQFVYCLAIGLFNIVSKLCDYE